MGNVKCCFVRGARNMIKRMTFIYLNGFKIRAINVARFWIQAICSIIHFDICEEKSELADQNIIP